MWAYMKFVFFSVSENGLSDEEAEGAMPPRIFGLELPLRMTLQVSWRNREAVMSQEETGEIVADEISQELDSRDELMHIETSNQWFSKTSG